jgi:aspartyl-tRNA(Asn)/glutamyl-tRNA(Gln) amidotransferase subunit C
MSSVITKHELEHLAKLARIELDPKEEEKLLHDLGAILDYFKELQQLDTAAVPPMTGGTDLRNIFREDGVDPDADVTSATTGVDAQTAGHENTNRGAGVETFPETKDGFLKVPPVFE